MAFGLNDLRHVRATNLISSQNSGVNNGSCEPPNHQLWTRGRESQHKLLRALETGDAQLAREFMVQHMVFAEKLMQFVTYSLLRSLAQIPGKPLFDVSPSWAVKLLRYAVRNDANQH